VVQTGVVNVDTELVVQRGVVVVDTELDVVDMEVEAELEDCQADVVVLLS
jgi:hypothetical protein